MAGPKALLFDVFGTSVDWYGGVSRELAQTLGRPASDATIIDITLAWRRAYMDGIRAVREGREPWRRVDEIHAEALARLLPEHAFALPSPDELEHLNLSWHRLDPWPDTLSGLQRLRRDHTIATLSNGNLDLIIDLTEHGGLPWDKLFCSDLFTRFKPDPATYLGACELLELPPEQVMMVACHRGDLDAAASHGLQTAFVARPDEYGGQTPADTAQDGDYDRVCDSITELADLLESQP